MYSSYCSFRCNGTQIIEYESYIRKLDSANDNAIFDLTGCLSKCHKYKYNVKPLGGVRKFIDGSSGVGIIPANAIQLMFYYPTTEHEVREQVCMIADEFWKTVQHPVKQNKIHLILVYHLWLGVYGRWCRRFPGLANRTKHLWNVRRSDQLAQTKEMI